MSAPMLADLRNRRCEILATARARVRVFGSVALGDATETSDIDLLVDLDDDRGLFDPEIPWREIIGTRVILAHAYFHVDQDIIGDVVKRDVPRIRDDLQALVDSLDPD